LAYSRYLEHLKPDWFVFENGVGLLTHKGGRTLSTLLDEFSASGYRVSFRVMNSAFYGVPQLRERLVVVGNKHGIDFSWPEPSHYFPYKSMAGNNNPGLLKPENKENCLSAVTVMDALDDLPELMPGQSASFYVRNNGLSSYQNYLREGSSKLTWHTASTHSQKMMRIIEASGYNINSVRHLVSSGFSSSYSRLEPDRPSVTMTVNFVHPSSNKCIHPIQNRALTPREGARIQGFQDAFKFCGSKTQVVKQIGNAVPPILSRVIAESIFKYY